MLPQERNQGVRLERFAQVAARSVRPSAFGEHVVVCRDENDRGCRSLGREQVLKIEAGQAAEVNVQHDAIGLARHVAMQKFLGGPEGLDANPVYAKRARKRSTKRSIVVNDADPRVLEAFRECRAGVLWPCHAISDDGQA
jgi:hypothetical protein